MPIKSLHKGNQMAENSTSEYMKIRRYVNGLIFKANGQSVQIPTILELAKKFDVCRQTVSKAMKELTAEGYVIGRKGIGSFTNPAKFMEHQFGDRFPVIGILFRDGCTTHLSAYDAHMAAELMKKITLLPAIVRIACIHDTDPEKNAEELEQEGFDAILWEQPDEKRREALKLLIKKTGIPVITTGNIYEGFAGVELDLEKAGYDCARLLIGEGRKNPVFMGNYNPWFRQAHGFRRAYEEAGIKLNDKLFLKHQNMDALKNILELGVPVDAVFNHPNQLRNEVFNLMKEMDIDIEKQCRLICNSLAASVNPDFQGYVYCIDFEQVAEKAVRMLQTGLAKGKLQPVHERVDLKITKQIKERNLQ